MLKPTQTVYSYYLPEVREIVGDVLRDFPHAVLLENIDPGLDDFHLPFVQAYTDAFPEVVGWDQYDHRYVTAGSSEAIFKIMAEIRAGDLGDEIPTYVLEGEYQGYQEYAKALGVPITVVKEYAVGDLEPGWFWLSNPSARDGNILASETFQTIVDRHQVILDMAYLGMTKLAPCSIDHPNIRAVLVSMSKPYGLYYFRTGICFSRDRLHSMEGNKWFKSVPSVLIGQAVLEEVDLTSVRERLSEYQARAIEEAGIKALASDVPLLAASKLNSGGAFADESYKRGDRYRWCLTPYIMHYDAMLQYLQEYQETMRFNNA